MRCADCGRSYPGELSSCPACGVAAGSEGGPLPEFLPLQPLGNLLTVALAVVVAVIAARLFVELLALGGTHWRRSFITSPLDKTADITIFVLGIAFVVWFHRARVNAEHSGWRQRRARAWTFWGWVIPIINLWFPFQLMGDIWRAGLPAGLRTKTAWLPVVWWTTWLLAGLTIGGKAKNYPWPNLAAGTLTVSLCCLAVSGLTLIAIIRTVSAGPLGSPRPGRPGRLRLQGWTGLGPASSSGMSSSAGRATTARSGQMTTGRWMSSGYVAMASMSSPPVAVASPSSWYRGSDVRISARGSVSPSSASTRAISARLGGSSR